MSKDIKNIIIAALGFMLLTGVLGYMYWTARSKAIEAQAKKDVLEGKIKELSEKAAQLGEKNAIHESLKDQLARYVEMLPHREVLSEEEILKHVNEAATKSEFALSRLNITAPKDLPGKKGTKKDPIQKVGISVSGTGSYKSFLRFANILETKKDCIFRVEKFSLSMTAPMTKTKAETLNVAMDLSTFWYSAK